MERSLFYEKHEQELKQYLEEYRSWLLDDIVPFWETRVVDKECGGYLNCFDRKGNLTRDCKPGWFVGRDLYAFSLLYNKIEKRPEWLEIAEEGRRQFETPFYCGDGHFNQMMDRKGNVICGRTSLFTDFFAAKGLYEYITASGKKEDVCLAEYLTEQIFRDAEDADVLYQLEHVEEGTMKHAVSFMSLIMALESTQIFRDRYLPSARKYADRITDEFANDQYKALFESIKEDGTPYLEGYGRIFDSGHSMESSWFVIRAAEELKEKKYYERACDIFDWVWDKTWDTENGGFFSHVDVERTVPEEAYLFEQYYQYPVYWDDKIWWTHAEAINAAISAALYGESEKNYQRFKEIDKYIRSHFRDPDYGEWYSILDRKGTVKAADKGTELKGPYHVPRCMVQVICLIERYLAGELPCFM